VNFNSAKIGLRVPNKQFRFGAKFLIHVMESIDPEMKPHREFEYHVNQCGLEEEFESLRDKLE